MEALFPFLATALATLAVNAAIQFWIIPRVETRKRREARWESDVLSLGEFLEFDLSDAVDEWMSAVYGMAFLQDPPARVDPTRLAEAREDRRRELRESGDRLQRAAAKADWLVGRASALEGFKVEAVRLRFDAMTAKHKISDAVFAANDRDKPPLDPDQSLQLRRDLTEVVAPLKVYAHKAIERAAPRPQTRLGFRLRRRRRLMWNGARKALARLPGRGSQPPTDA